MNNIYMYLVFRLKLANIVNASIETRRDDNNRYKVLRSEARSYMIKTRCCFVQNGKR